MVGFLIAIHWIYFFKAINVSNVSSKTKFEIYSVGGQLVNQGTTDGKVNVSKLAKGVYILSLESNGEKSQTKFIKN